MKVHLFDDSITLNIFQNDIKLKKYTNTNERYEIFRVVFQDCTIEDIILEHLEQSYRKVYGDGALEDFVMQDVVLLKDKYSKKMYFLSNSDIDFKKPISDEDINELMKLSANRYAVEVHL